MHTGVATERRVSGAARRGRRVPLPYAVGWPVLTALAFGAGLALLVPWDWLPGGDLAAVDPTGGLSPQRLARVEAHQGSVRWWQLAYLAAPLLALLALGLTPAGARLVRGLPGRERIWPLRVMLAVVTMVGLGWLVALPFAAGVERARNAEGFVTSGWSAWLGDQLGRLFTLWAVASAVVLLVGLGARVLRWSWWCILSVVVGALVMAGAAIAGQLGTSSAGLPAMPDGPLRTSLLQLADEAGVQVVDIKLVPESRTHKVFNAYVAPVADGYEVVVFETMLRRTSPDEVRFVAAHELGHVARDDSLTSGMLLGLATTAGVATAGAVGTSRRLRRRAGIRSTGAGSEPAAVPMLLALGVVVAVVMVPVLNAATRAIEARADVLALEVTRDPAASVDLQRTSAWLNLKQPYPGWPARMWATHPSLAERAALARGWRQSRD